MTSALKWGGVDGFPKKQMIFLISCVSGIVTRGGEHKILQMSLIEAP